MPASKNSDGDCISDFERSKKRQCILDAMDAAGDDRRKGFSSRSEITPRTDEQGFRPVLYGSMESVSATHKDTLTLTGEMTFPKLNGEMNHKKKCLLCFCVLSHFMSGLSTSLLAPFYPQVAQRKGMSLTLIGVTFSLFPLMNILFSPIFGSYMTRIGPKFMVVSGIFVGGVCNILYGTLNKCPDGTPFIVISLACRLVEGIGFTAYCVSIFTIVSTEFPNFATMAISFLATSSELGLMLGPGIGGFLYDLGGFGVPFYTAGIAVVLNGLVLYIVVPNLETANKSKSSISSTFSFLRNGLVIAGMASTSATSAAISFIEATLANHLAPLKLSASVVGLLFTIVPFLFVITSPLYSFLADKKGLTFSLMVTGQFVFGLGFYLIGPGLVLPFSQLNSWSVISGLILIGASFGGCYLPPFKCFFNGARESGMEDDVQVSAVTASFQNTLFFLGAFAGPLIGNALIEHKGHRFGYTAIGTFNIAVMLMCLVIFLSRKARGV